MIYDVSSTEAFDKAVKVLEDKRRILSRRFSPLDGIGTDLRGETSYQEAMRVSGVGFEPVEKDLITLDGIEISTHKAIFNGTNLLSVMKKGYTTIPNMEAFRLAEDLVAEGDFKYEVGSIQNNGKTSRLILSGDVTNILGEAFLPYAVLSNSFDGSSGLSLKIMYLRLACLNGLVREWEEASSSIWLPHTSTKEKRVEQLMLAANKSLEVRRNIEKEAEILSQVPFSREEFAKEIIPKVIAKAYAPQEKLLNLTERQQNHVTELIATTLAAYDAEDLQNFNGTAYKVLLTMADLDSHMKTRTKDPNVYINRLLQNGLIGASLTNIVGNYMLKRAGIRNFV